jgi:hypothetical protein
VTHRAHREPRRIADKTTGEQIAVPHRTVSPSVLAEFGPFKKNAVSSSSSISICIRISPHLSAYHRPGNSPPTNLLSTCSMYRQKTQRVVAARVRIEPAVTVKHGVHKRRRRPWRREPDRLAAVVPTDSDPAGWIAPSMSGGPPIRAGHYSCNIRPGGVTQAARHSEAFIWIQHTHNRHRHGDKDKMRNHLDTRKWGG